MAKKTRIMNPGETRDLASDADAALHGSSTAIDALFIDYKSTAAEIRYLNSIREDLIKSDQPVPKELSQKMRERKERLRALDRRIDNYGRVTVNRLKDKLDSIKRSPIATFNKSQISAAERAIFRLEKKTRQQGADIRPDVISILGILKTIRGSEFKTPKPKAPERAVSDRDLLKALQEEWALVYKYARYSEAVREDVDWIDAQVKFIARRVKRGEPIGNDISAVSRRMAMVRAKTKPRKLEAAYADFKADLRAFVDRVRNMGETLPAATVDKLQRELEALSRSVPLKDRAEWSREDRSAFSSDMRKVRKWLKSRARRGNPCVGLHFKADETDELFKALEESAKRIDSQGPKKNPKKATKKATFSNPKKKATKKMSKKNPINNPEYKLRKIPKSASPAKVLSIIKENIQYGIEWGETERRATEKAIESAQKDRSVYDISWIVEDDPVLGRMVIDTVGIGGRMDAPSRGGRRSNPKKKATKKAPSKKSAESLISTCQRRWTAYCKKPSKKALLNVLEHLETMKDSKSSKVKKERSACLRVANKEARRLKII